jgi:DNA-binding transcriptional LysR family regulator
LDTRFLQSLIAVVETGSIAGAARLQGLTAAAVSQRIRVLENELNCTLLKRSAQAAVPTENCLHLLPAARNLVLDAQRLGAHIDPGGLRGPYRLGAISTALLDFIPGLIETFRTIAPDVDLSIRPGTSLGLYEEVLSGNLDAAITVMPPFALPKGVGSRVLIEQPLVHIAPGNWEVSDDHQGGILPWILYDRLSWGGRMIWELHKSDIGQGRVLCELDALETIALMVTQGSGQAIVPRWGKLNDQQLGLKITPLPGKATRRIVFLQMQTSVTPVLGDLAFDALRVPVS